MSADWVQYHNDISPRWWLSGAPTTGAGYQWNRGQGTIENGFQTQCLQKVEARFPDFAPSDAYLSGVPMAGPAFTTPVQATLQFQYAAELVVAGLPFTVGVIYVAGQLVQYQGATYRCLIGGFIAALPGPSAVIDGGGNVWQLATALYLKGGFSQGPQGQTAAGLTRSWLPTQTVTTQDVVGGGGLAWVCTTPGTTDLVNPFDSAIAFSVDASAPGEKDLGDDAGAAVLLQTAYQAPLGQTVVEVTGVTWRSLGSLSNAAGALTGPTYQVVAPDLRGVGVSTVGPNSYVTCQQAPGWYWAGTDQGLLDSLVAAGYYNTVSGVQIIPRIYHERDLIVNAVVALGAGFAQLIGAWSAEVDLDVTLQSFEEVTFLPHAGAPVWAAFTVYGPGSFVTSANGDVYWTVAGLTAGATSPFPGTTPHPGPWPGGPVYPDGGGVWSLADITPIPTTLPITPSLGLAFSGTFGGSAGPVEVSYSPRPPDNNPAAWARVWLVIPAGQLIGGTNLWGFTGLMAHIGGVGNLVVTVLDEGIHTNPVAVSLVTTGPSAAVLTIKDTLTNATIAIDSLISLAGTYTDSTTNIEIGFAGTSAGGDTYTLGWLWDGAPVGQPAPAIWGESTGYNAWGQIQQICSRWLPAHVQLVGAWITPPGTAQTTLDTIPTAPWNEVTDVTIGGVLCPFFRYALG